ncbi:unnamed protein product [Caretta caretta]
METGGFIHETSGRIWAQVNRESDFMEISKRNSLIDLFSPYFHATTIEDPCYFGLSVVNPKKARYLVASSTGGDALEMAVEGENTEVCLFCLGLP